MRSVRSRCPFETLAVHLRKRKKAGASDEIVCQIMNDNPRRLPALVPKIKHKASPMPGQFTKGLIRRKMQHRIDRFAAQMAGLLALAKRSMRCCISDTIELNASGSNALTNALANLEEL
jgi:hypothetical protein